MSTIINTISSGEKYGVNYKKFTTNFLKIFLHSNVALSSTIRLDMMLILLEKQLISRRAMKDMLSISYGKLEFHIKLLEKAELIEKKYGKFDETRDRIFFAPTNLFQFIIDAMYLAYKKYRLSLELSSNNQPGIKSAGFIEKFDDQIDHSYKESVENRDEGDDSS